MKTTLLWGCIFGLTAIGIGAFGAHGLKEMLTENQLETLATGVKYQMYHSLFLLFLGLLQQIKPELRLHIVRNLTVVGVFFFSFSIYLLLSQAELGIELPFLWAITPIGGLLLMSAWLMLMIKIMLITREVEK